jgi:hypothetical protein
MPKSKRITKSTLRVKFKKKEDFTKADVLWMDSHDWHPVDELPLKKSFVKSLLKSRSEKTTPTSIEELLGKQKKGRK